MQPTPLPTDILYTIYYIDITAGIHLTPIFSSQMAFPSPFPFSLPLHSPTYITHQHSSMAASRFAARPRDARSATLFLGRGPPKNTYGGLFHTPRPNTHGGGPTLPYPPTPLTLRGPKLQNGQLTPKGPKWGLHFAPPFWAHGQVTPEGPNFGGCNF